MIPIRRWDLSEAKLFAGYTNVSFRGKGMPRMSEALRRKFFESLDEIFQNSVQHSKSKSAVISCGQQFPTKHELDFVIADTGIGMRESLNQFNMPM